MNQGNQKAFVGTRSIASDELKRFLETLPSSSRCYFLRWVHRVSGFVENLNKFPNEFPSPEGQMHTPEFEVRWKQVHQSYELLLLHSGSADAVWGFEPLQKDPDWDWVTPKQPLETHLHPNGKLDGSDGDRQDTRFPNRFDYTNDLKLEQRYFQNANTGTVHFVALTLPKETR